MADIKVNIVAFLGELLYLLKAVNVALPSGIKK